MQVSEVRKKLPQLLRRLRKNPNDMVRITVHGDVLGELRAPRSTKPTMNPGAALLKAIKNVGEPTEPYPEGQSVARNHDDYLYVRSNAPILR